MDRKHKGCHSELIACSWLMAQGYEVFRNLSQHGPADIIAWVPGEEPILIDVKTASEYINPKTGQISYSFAGKPANHPQVKFYCH